MNHRFAWALTFLAWVLPGHAGAQVNLTVYNGGTALVHDRRTITLHRGVNHIAWRNVSAGMDATSALLASLSHGASLNVVEQNFDYDLLDPAALLQKYVGRYVTVVHDARFAGEHDTRERAKVLSTNGGIVLQYRDRIETELRGHIVLPISSKSFRDRPTLVLEVDSTQSGPQLLDLSYLTGGLSWSADYVGTISAEETRLALTGLVTLSNTSGIDYPDARLQLVAGNVNVAGQPTVAALRTIAHVTSAADSALVTQENYFEYHLYTLQRATSVRNNQTKQLTLLTARDIPVRKTLELRGSAGYYRDGEPDLGDRLPVGVFLTFVIAAAISAFRFRPVRFASTRATPPGCPSSWERTRSTTRPRTKRFACIWAIHST